MYSLWIFVICALTGVAVAAGLFVAWEEWRWLKRHHRLDASARRETWMSLSLLPPNIIVSILTSGVWIALHQAASQFSMQQIPTNAGTVLLVFLAADFTYYWEHRCSHKVGLLWALYHAPHHSSNKLTVATAYRVSCLNQLFAPAFYLPLTLLGFDPLVVAAFQLFVFHYQAWLHTEMIGSLGVMDRWFNTPANHRVHHSTALHHQDRNMGAVLLVWDRLFGSYAKAEAVSEYGIRGTKPPQQLLAIYMRPFVTTSLGVGAKPIRRE
jgi:sterol desaturase/sphingolipid hydroxylase (fatty acid hydroxylase superfamily)